MNKFNYLYKIRNKTNEMIYIGIHTTNNLNDGYICSGTKIRKAISSEGINNFERKILQFFNTYTEAKEAERTIVNTDFINRADTYNIALGGGDGWANKISAKDKNGSYVQCSINDQRWLDNELVGYTSGLFVCKNNLNEVKLVSKSDEKFINGEYYSIHKEMIVAKDKNDNYFYVSIHDPRYISGELIAFSKNMVTVKNKTNKSFRVSKNIFDNSNELVGIMKNRVTVKDKDGNTMSVYVNNPRYISGELVHHSKGMVSVLDKDGNKLWIENTNIGLTNGEYTALSKNRTFKHKHKMKLRTCPHCGKEGRGGRMTVHHFDNCKNYSISSSSELSSIS